MTKMAGLLQNYQGGSVIASMVGGSERAGMLAAAILNGEYHVPERAQTVAAAPITPHREQNQTIEL